MLGGTPNARSFARILISNLALLVAGCGSSETSPTPATTTPDDSANEVRIEPDAEPAGPALFVDAAADSGLDFRHWNGMTGKFYYAEMMGSGAALFDADNDGDLDVYLVQGGALDDAEPTFPPPGPLPLKDRLFRNDLTVDADGVARLRFTDVTEESGIESTGYGMGVAAADFDNDGWTDLYVTNLERNQLFRNLGRDASGNVTFEDVTDASGAGVDRWSVPAVAFDYDRDGWLDLFVGNYVEFSTASNKRCTDELGLPNYCGPLSFKALPDVLLRNLGGKRGPRFRDVTHDAGIHREYGGCLGAVAADFDGDGRLDLYVANDGMPNQLWIHRRDGFDNRALLAGAAVSGQGHPEASMGVAAADFDDDGDEDLFLAHLTRETNTLYVNDGRGFFEDRSAATGLGAPSLSMTAFGTGWLDVDNDGRLDLLAVNGAVKVIKSLHLAGDPFPLHQPNQLFLSRGDAFEDATSRAGAAFELSEVSRGAAFGDVDNDGDTDVLITNNNGPARLLLNQVGQDTPWLGLRLVDRRGRDALGARAGVVRAGAVRERGTLWRRVGANGSYGSSSDPRLLFGLGNEVSRVVVEWPDGGREQWPVDAVRPGGYVTLWQGSGGPWSPER